VRFNQLAGKEIINLRDGLRMGRLGEATLVIDEATGRIDSMAVPLRAPRWRTGPDTAIPWTSVCRVGPDVLIVDLDLSQGAQPLRRS
jgi:YlmC/YmxH family sporulation protein